MRTSKPTRNPSGHLDFVQAQAERDNLGNQPGKIFVVGIGPGDPAHMTVRVKEIWQEVDTVAGYKTYLELIRPFLGSQEIVATAMRQEIERCQEVVRLASLGRKVALVSSGDAGIYGMAGILIECLEQANRLDIKVEIIPGITAANAAASLVGAPLMHDFAVISLSDLLTPWEVIERRVRLAAEGDFVIALYNPKSKGRTSQIERVREIILAYRKPHTPVGIVREALRGSETAVTISSLADFTKQEIDMLSTVIIGNSQTRRIGPYLVTPRGYHL